jgi:hypothetical protein
MNEDDVTGLRSQFNEAFYVPAKFNWRSRRAMLHWIEVAHLNVDIAGPVFSIVEKGGCNYVYSREDDYFWGVDNPAALRNRLLQSHNEMVEIIDSFVPRSSAETADLVSMRQFRSDIGNVIEAACDTEQRRWDNETGR